MYSRKKSILKQCLLLLFIAVVVIGCTAPKKTYQREYRRLWQEIIKSTAWKNALRANKSFSYDDQRLRYTSPANSFVSKSAKLTRNLISDQFKEEYTAWVTQAYNRIIADAKAADKKIKAEYDRLLELKKTKGDRGIREQQALAKKKYQAHRQMLEGLESWDAFSPYGSDDLDFFMEENMLEVYQMHLNGQSVETLVSFLMYKLADLYHFSDE